MQWVNEIKTFNQMENTIERYHLFHKMILQKQITNSPRLQSS